MVRIVGRRGWHARHTACRWRRGALRRNMRSPSGPASSRAPPSRSPTPSAPDRGCETRCTLPPGHSRAHGALRPTIRTRRLRRLVRRQHQRRSQPRDRRRWASARCATWSTAAPPGAEADTGDGAGILIQVPTGSCARSPSSRCRADGALRRRPGLPAGRPDRRREGAGGDRARSSPTRSLHVLGWRDVPVEP